MKILLILAVLLIPWQTSEKTVGHNVQFVINKNHTLTPVLPIQISVEQEDGGIADGLLTCDTIQRTEPDRHSVVFSCQGKKFRVVGWSFTQSESKGVR